MTITPEILGWNAHFAKAFEQYESQGFLAGRLIRETKINFSALLLSGEERETVVAGRLWNEAKGDADLPAVGDWVAIDLKGDDPIIQAVLPRQSRFSRKMTGKSSDEQVICANVHYVVVVTDPDGDFNPRRLERYFLLIEKTGCRPVVVLNKQETVSAEQLEECKKVIKSLSPTVAVHCMSAIYDDPLERLSPYLQEGKTVALVGSSGVGKSTILNRIIRREVMSTSNVNRLTGKGRHTTTARELVVLPGGGLLVDNPGMREIQMWTDEETIRESFQDIETLVSECQFHDCKHLGDRGCAVQAAVASGRLEEDRYESYLNLEAEIAELNRRRKKRKMTTERWSKRHNRVQARNLADRIQLEKDARGEL